MQEEDDLDMESLKRLAEDGERKAKQGISVSQWHATNEFQAAQEWAIADELIKSLRQQGRADVRNLESNADGNELPDCHATLDGARIGIEVTQLIEARQHWSDWPLERFEGSWQQLFRKRTRRPESQSARRP